MRCLLLLLLTACEGGTIRVPGDPVVPVDRPDDPTDTPTTGETAPLSADSAGPPLLEHVCSGTVAYEFDWDVAPQTFDRPPMYGVWALRSEGKHSWYLLGGGPGIEPDGRPSSYCGCDADGCDPVRFVLFEL
jgi:hypothetical protein